MLIVTHAPSTTDSHRRVHCAFLILCILDLLSYLGCCAARCPLQTFQQFAPGHTVHIAYHIDTWRQATAFHDIVSFLSRFYPIHFAHVFLQTATEPQTRVREFVKETQETTGQSASYTAQAGQIVYRFLADTMWRTIVRWGSKLGIKGDRPPVFQAELMNPATEPALDLTKGECFRQLLQVYLIQVDVSIQDGHRAKRAFEA